MLACFPRTLAYAQHQSKHTCPHFNHDVKVDEKHANERQQSAKGLICDLDLMLSEHESSGNLSSFVLAQNNILKTIIAPQNLCGRSSEFELLLSLVNEISTSTLELVLVEEKVELVRGFLHLTHVSLKQKETASFLRKVGS